MHFLVGEVVALALFLVCNSYSQEDKGDNYAVHVDKDIDIREIIRFGGPRKAVSEQTISGLKGGIQTLMKFQDMFSLSGLKSAEPSGHAIVCGPKNASLNITWTPKKIDPQGSIYLHFNIVAPISFDKGKVHIDVYMEESPEPIFSVDQDVTCSMAKQKFSLLPCPIPQGYKLATGFTYKDLTKLPTGTYTIVVKLISSASKPNDNLFACLNMTLIIQPESQSARSIHNENALNFWNDNTL